MLASTASLKTADDRPSIRACAATGRATAVVLVRRSVLSRMREIAEYASPDDRVEAVILCVRFRGSGGFR
jgi:hypothetical protein